MFKKRALLLFFTIFSTGLFSQETAREVVNEVFNYHPDVIYADGLLTVDELEKEFSLYREKGDFFTLSQSIKIDTNTIKDFNSNELFNDSSLPLDVMNNIFMNNEFSFEKKGQYKNISSYVIKSNKSSDVTENETSLDRFEKRVLTIGNYPRVILKCDFYLRNTDKSPTFTYEVENIAYINEIYIVTSWSYKDVKKNKEYNFDLNIESLILDKQKVKDKSIIPGR